MSPLANAVCFIYHKPAQVFTFVKILQRSDKLAAYAQFFGGNVEQFCLRHGAVQIFVNIVDNSSSSFSSQLKGWNLPDRINKYSPLQLSTLATPLALICYNSSKIQFFPRFFIKLVFSHFVSLLCLIFLRTAFHCRVFSTYVYARKRLNLYKFYSSNK